MRYFGFVIDTTDYAGNFSREVVAHMTGQYGQCEVGKDIAENARRELVSSPNGDGVLIWCGFYIVKRTDAHGCHRPAAIVPTPGWFNDGLGNHWQEGADPALVAQKYAETARRMVSFTPPQGPGHWPAYLSVVAWFDKEPPVWIRDILLTRAKTFLAKPDEWRQPVEVTGFRLIEEESSM